MDYTVGSILAGKVTGITNFGAFVTFDDGKTGLVHISEVANTFVNNVSDHLSVGQEVKVKLIGMGDDGKMNLSIKKAALPPARHESAEPREIVHEPKPIEEKELSFEDKLKQFMHDSDSKIAGVRQYEKKPSRRRGGNSGGNDW